MLLAFHRLITIALIASALDSVATPTHAVTIELKGDAAIDRIERQRLASRGQLPLPGTPDLSKLEERIAGAGFAKNAPIFLRLFKDTSTLELWMQKGERFALFATYPICNWDGTLGPKLLEGDRQSPEGFYRVGEGSLRYSGRYHRAFDLNYPNLLDSSQGRTGSAILIHGACSTVGCFAMTNPVIAELFLLGTRAMAGGQKAFSVHVLPFHLTEAALEQRKDSRWIDFWRNLKIGYDMFERTRVPPQVGVCNRRYTFDYGPPGYQGDGPIDYRCGMWMAGGGEVEAMRVAALPLPQFPVPVEVAAAAAERVSRPSRKAAHDTQVTSGPWRPSRRLVNFVNEQIGSSGAPAQTQIAEVRSRRSRTVPAERRAQIGANGLAGTATARAFASCNTQLASCRKFLDLKLSRNTARKRKGKTVAAVAPAKTRRISAETKRKRG